MGIEKKCNAVLYAPLSLYLQLSPYVYMLQDCLLTKVWIILKPRRYHSTAFNELLFSKLQRTDNRHDALSASIVVS
jgi:hypothetical protein